MVATKACQIAVAPFLRQRIAMAAIRCARIESQNPSCAGCCAAEILGFKSYDSIVTIILVVPFGKLFHVSRSVWPASERE